MGYASYGQRFIPPFRRYVKGIVIFNTLPGWCNPAGVHINVQHNAQGAGSKDTKLRGSFLAPPCALGDELCQYQVEYTISVQENKPQWCVIFHRSAVTI
jgi:hypothetical protein